LTDTGFNWFLETWIIVFLLDIWILGLMLNQHQSTSDTKIYPEACLCKSDIAILFIHGIYCVKRM